MKLSDKGIIIRKSIESDLPQIYTYAINEPSLGNLPFKLNPENLADIFASEKSICYSAVRKKKVLGFIIGSVNEGISHIHWMIVKESFRRAGLGSELLEKFLKNSKKINADIFFIAVIKNNPHAVNFLTKNSFTVKENFVELQRKF